MRTSESSSPVTTPAGTPPGASSQYPYIPSLTSRHTVCRTTSFDSTFVALRSEL